MKLHPDWKAIVKRAWSLRFIALAGLAAAVETAIQVVTSGLGFSALVSLAIALASAAAAVARVIAQENLDG